MQEIRLTYFCMPYLLNVPSNAGGADVIILRTFFFFIYEFIRFPVHIARQFADLLEAAAEKAAAAPVVSGKIGEINGESVRPLGTAQVRIRLSVKKFNSIGFGIRKTVGSRRTVNGRPKISVKEARRFANILRQANDA